MKQIKILAIGHSYIVALNRSPLRLLAEDERYHVTVAAPKFFHGSLQDTHLQAEPEGSNIHLVGLDTYLTQKMHVFFYNPFQLKKLLKQDFDYVHMWEEPYIVSGYQVARACRKQKVPYCIYTTQSLVKNYPQPFSYFDTMASQNCAHWLGCGELVKQAMVERGWDEDKGKVLYLSVDTSLFRPMSEEQKQQKRQELGLEGPVIGMLGRLTEEKGCDILMSAVDNLDKQKPWSLLIMGSGPYREKFLAWAKKRGLSDRIHIQLLTHEEVPKMLPVCDLLVCPSQTRRFWKEQFGRMLVEAFASGVPVIGSDSGEIPYVLGDAGVVVGEKDVVGWTKAIEQMVFSHELRAEYTQKGLERVSMFSVKSVASEYGHFFENTF